MSKATDISNNQDRQSSEPTSRNGSRSKKTRSNTENQSPKGQTVIHPGTLSTIRIRGARQHNLKNIDLDLPRDRLIVFTGVSGSGKSSLAFDTIFAEGQRRYVESLSAYARQFLGQVDKPDVDSIEGLSPAISIDQKSTSHNPRSTVGTVTEIYDYLRLLFGRAGEPHCPHCDRSIAPQTIDQMVDRIMELPDRTRFQILAPVVRGKKGTHRKLLSGLASEGFVRVRIDGEVRELSDSIELDKNQFHHIEIVVDRLVKKAGLEERLVDSLTTCLRHSEGIAMIDVMAAEGEGTAANNVIPLNPGVTQLAAEEGGEYAAAESLKGKGKNSKSGQELVFSENFACPEHGAVMEELSPRLFSFNSPYGACPNCHGLGSHRTFAPDLVIPNPALPVYAAIAPWSEKDNTYYLSLICSVAEAFKFDIKTPWNQLTPEQQQVLLHGSQDPIWIEVDSRYRENKGYHRRYEGVIPILDRQYQEAGSEVYKQKLEQYLVDQPCEVCRGRRLKPESLAVRLGQFTIVDLTGVSIRECLNRVNSLTLSDRQAQIADLVLREVKARLQFLLDVGLDYLTLDRTAMTLSGGEAQRIRLATQIGSGLTGVLYVLDEPSIGLHQRDNGRLLKTLTRLRDLGNTLIVVEHDEETIRAADHLVDIGPGAGIHGGRVIAQGDLETLLQAPDSLTGAYLSGREVIRTPEQRRKGNGRSLRLKDAHRNNLKHIDVEIPLGKLVSITGVSGSGKSTLVNELLLPALQHHFGQKVPFPKEIGAIEGLNTLDKVIVIDQSPIGRTPRSNPATYTGTFDVIRDIFAETIEAKARGYKPGQFSFNVKGGRCEACSGQGVNVIEMNFLPDVYVQCEVCKGARYNRETLQVKYKDKSIADVLSMTVEEALEFCCNIPQAAAKLQTLLDVGLGYIRLGQTAPTLSGGEAQRVKLATELSRRATGKTLYLIDEPTTGLSFYDVHKLLDVVQRLVDKGNSVLVIEHNLDVIRCADWVIDLGPEGGDRGGEVIALGTPEQVAQVPQSFTGHYLQQVL
ncbi:excinuclease ABC subunit A [Leptolyngbya sp. 'hensonii']|uniref:excinuclease ABC subunit UvrA n=1 Tax=Leptolyngbya sp. 'hensonii' TaxID=1922337 RepID=UPI00095C6404|nr:excinuclease ABC subunit UvrA [Leptolyngbya sp. 'hensonii']OLP17334.1 excinuclease ABC subunit A [Leptolyngbya sp. 'hensonii']